MNPRRTLLGRFLAICFVAVAVGWPAAHAGAALERPAAHMTLARGSQSAVSQVSVTIHFSQPPNTTVGHQVPLRAWITDKFLVRALTVTLTSDTLSVCTVSGSVANPVASGTCTITASLTGATAVKAVTRSFQVNPVVRSQTITFPQPRDTTIGHQVTLTASASSGLQVSLSSQTPSVCTVSDSMLNPVGPGTCTIIASQSGNADYASARPVTQSDQVSADSAEGAAQTIIFPAPLGTRVDRQVTLTASASSGLPVTLTSDTVGVCTMSGPVVSTVAPGTCTITASQPGDTDYAAARAVTQSFQVSRIHIRHRAQTIKFEKPRHTTVGRTVRMSASASSGLRVAFSSDTPRVCTVSGSTVTTAAAGKCRITASQGGNAHYAAARSVTRSFRVGAVALISHGAQGPQTLIIALGTALVAAAGIAGTVLVRRRQPRSRRRPLEPSVRAEPHAGPPTMVGVHATGTDATQTVRIEPSPGTRSVRTRKVSP